VPKRGVKKRKLSQNFQNKTKIKQKLSIEELPGTTIEVTIRALRWIFILIFVYISVSIILLASQGGDNSVTNIQQIVVYSISGFFTFFMGYFGWMFARNVLEIISGKKQTEEVS